MAFIEPMHRNKPNITYLLYLGIYIYHMAILMKLSQAFPVCNEAQGNKLWISECNMDLSNNHRNMFSPILEQNTFEKSTT